MPWFLLTLLVAQAPAVDLKTRLQALITQSGAEVSVAVVSADRSRDLIIDGDRSFHAASTMKVPVMIELFRQAHEGTLKLDDALPIRNEFHSIVDGSVYQMDVGDDSDAEVYKQIGKTMTLRALCEAMITVSSNFAANLLIERVGAKNVQATVDRLGGTGVAVLRGVEDQKAFDKGMNNVTTARGLAALLWKIAQGEAVSAAADREMIEILKRQKFNDAIPAGVPPGTAVAHKTGSITRIHHDAGIVFAPQPYVLVVLTRGIEDQKVSGPLIAAISREVWAARAGK
jgi:beta-lactamase class A